MKEKEITVLKVEPGKSPETVTMHLMAHDTDATLNELEQLRGRCVQDVMRTHGMISFKEIFRFQKRL